MQGLRDLGGDVGEDGGDRRREKTRRGVFVFGGRVFDDQQAHALQRRVQIAQRQHHRRARAVAAQEARLARRAQHEGVERIVQRLAKLDAEIGGGAVEHFAARVVQRDRAIARVRQRLLEAGHPARRNFNDLFVEHRRADGRLARFRLKRRPMWTDVGPFPEFLDECPGAQGYRIPYGPDVMRLAVLPKC